MNIVGLFSGIGGLELPFRDLPGERLLCEWWEPAREVLAARFPDVEIHEDVTTLRDLPAGTDLVTAGFPCTDFSQAGRTAGFDGNASILVMTVFALLKRQRVETLVLENVPNMLVLGAGRAMVHLTETLEDLGYRWAYRLVDSRFTGVPQRRYRVILVACLERDPRRILFADQATAPSEDDARRYAEDAYGFYWTEGRTGLGWARDAVPPLKGGSNWGIPSPPAVWLPDAPTGEAIRIPSIEAAERLQGFRRHWTRAAETGGKRSNRWKLVGNAVSVGVGKWVARRLLEPGDPIVESERMRSIERWPNAAYGIPGARSTGEHRAQGKVYRVHANAWPTKAPPIHLSTLLERYGSTPLSERATRGFLERVRSSNLRTDPAFERALAHHVEAERRRAVSAAVGNRRSSVAARTA